MASSNSEIYDVIDWEHVPSHALPSAGELLDGFYRLSRDAQRREMARLETTIAAWPAEKRVLAQITLAEVAGSLELPLAAVNTTPGEIAITAEAVLTSFLSKLAELRASGPLGVSVVERVIAGLTSDDAAARLDARITEVVQRRAAGRSR